MEIFRQNMRPILLHQGKRLKETIIEGLAFSLASTSAEASAGTAGQTAGFGQGSILKDALFIKKTNPDHIIYIILMQLIKNGEN